MKTKNDRYLRQLPLIGDKGQSALKDTKLLLIGCGALGSHLATMSVRSGIGSLKIVDRDCVELHNLARQTLFDEEDAKKDKPKAIAAKEKLIRINSEVEIEAIVADVDRSNIFKYAKGCDLIFDGTDNFETRFILNDYAVSESIPWIYAGVTGFSGTVLPIIPGGPCLRCFLPEMPDSQSVPTIITEGISITTIASTTAQQFSEALRFLVEGIDKPVVTHIDVYHGDYQRFILEKDSKCPCCGGL